MAQVLVVAVEAIPWPAAALMVGIKLDIDYLQTGLWYTMVR
ncbi:hypothetical protein [Legionella clemsonensis]|nr:hypothetical protein [Legionella clemsonensis]